MTNYTTTPRALSTLLLGPLRVVGPAGAEPSAAVASPLSCQPLPFLQPTLGFKTKAVLKKRCRGPTCQGNEIPPELEKQLVALIPFGDQRLKPRHTELFVFLAVLICLVTSSLTIFFLFPRSSDPQPAGLNSSSTVALDETVYINITNILNISNSNYYPFTVTQLIIEVLHLSVVVGQVSNSLFLHIGPLARKQLFYAVANRILDENTYKICSWLKIKVPIVIVHIQGTLTYICLSHSEQKVFQSYEYVDCRENTPGPHLLVPHLP